MMGASDVRRVTVLGHGARLLATRGAGRHLGRPQTGGRTGPNTSLALPHRCRTGRGVHLDLYANDQTAEIERLLGLGASGVHGQD